MGGLEQRLTRLEKEVTDLKRLMVSQEPARAKVSLKGTLKGVQISRRDVQDAKRSVFPARPR